jgi:hypothetical protein
MSQNPKTERSLLTMREMVSGPNEKWIKFKGKDLLIQRINLGLIADISKYAGDDAYQLMIHILFKGIKEPKFTLDQIKLWDPTSAGEIVRQISDLSGFSQEEVDKITNLSLVEDQPGQSGE